jgi:Rrf2 family transcriptional regulator, iron-sulfur cluster assembly transcription factor
MRVTTRGRYAIRAIVRLARNDNGKPIAIKYLADDEDISPEFLEQIFFRLRKAGIIDSTRGPGGGFKLRKTPDTITLTEIFEAVDEGLALTPCLFDDEHDKKCNKTAECELHDFWTATHKHFKKYFDGITVADIVSGQAM